MDRLTEIRLWHEDVKMRYDDKPSRAHQDREVMLSEIDKLQAEIERLRTGLHRVSLASQNSMSSKGECGRIARETLDAKS